MIFIFLRKKTDFRAFFLLFTASVRSRPPGPPAVPGVFRLVLQGAMEKFVVIGNSKEKKMTVNLSLPIAKHSKPHVVKKCEEQVYPHDIITQAVNRKKFESTHIKPLVDRPQR